MDGEEDDFRPRLGRMRPRGKAPRLRSLLVVRVRRAAVGPSRPGAVTPTGRFNARGRGARVAASVPRGNGWQFDRGLGLNVRGRRVTVKARVVKVGGKLDKVTAHLRYIERDGVARDGAPGRLYSTFSDEVDGATFVARQGGDRHQFRLIVSPEDGAEFDNLRPFTRDLMAQMERDLGTTLDWVAADHHDTGHPHTHIVIRGRCEDGKTLNIAGDYIAHGIRHRASEIMTHALGPQTEREVADQLAREVDAERFTRLDKALMENAIDQHVDLRLVGDGDPAFQQLLIGRARTLETMGLAAREGPLVWRLEENAHDQLVEMGRRGDIIRTMHHAMSQAGIERRPELYEVEGSAGIAAPVVGRLVRYGASDEFHERRFVIVDGLDGRTHYVDIGEARTPMLIGAVVRLDPQGVAIKPADRVVADVAAANEGRYSIDAHLAHDPSASQAFAESHVRRLEALRRSGANLERDPDGMWRVPSDHLANAEAVERERVRAMPVAIEYLTRDPVDRVAGQMGPTALDTELIGNNLTASVAHGFGSEWRAALALRQQWLIDQGLAEIKSDGISYPADLVGRLRVREMAALAAGLAEELGLAYREVSMGDRIEGRLARDISAGSNRYALIERSHDFTLVPWREVLDRRVGQSVSGIVRPAGVSWTFGRERSGPAVS